MRKLRSMLWGTSTFITPPNTGMQQGFDNAYYQALGATPLRSQLPAMPPHGASSPPANTGQAAELDLRRQELTLRLLEQTLALIERQNTEVTARQKSTESATERIQSMIEEMSAMLQREAPPPGGPGGPRMAMPVRDEDEDDAMPASHPLSSDVHGRDSSSRGPHILRATGA